MKKTMIVPRAEVIRLQDADLICTSPQTQTFQLIEDEEQAISYQNQIW